MLTKPHGRQFTMTAIAMLFLLPLSASPNERLRTLGKDPLGESLKEFLVRYPKAVCGSRAFRKAKTRNLANVTLTGKVYCYIDDKDSLTRVSSSLLLSLDVRAVYAIFWKSRLYNLMCDLNVQSLRTVRIPFEEIYGPPTFTGMNDPAYPMKLTYLYWSDGDTKLQVRLCPLDEVVGQQKDSIRAYGIPVAEAVCIELWKGELSPTGWNKRAAKPTKNPPSAR
jgi:hypothetical protein